MRDGFYTLLTIALGLAIAYARAAHGQELPSEEQKAWALRKAYELNGSSMVGWGSIDLSGEPELKALQAGRAVVLGPDQVVCSLREGASTGQAYFDCPQPKTALKRKGGKDAR